MKPTTIQRKILENKEAGRRWDFGRALGVPNDGWWRAYQDCQANGWLIYPAAIGVPMVLSDAGRAVLEATT